MKGEGFPKYRTNERVIPDLIAVDRESINHHLSAKPKGRALAIAVGGANEVLEAHPGTYKLCLAKRKGFIRAAIENG